MLRCTGVVLITVALVYRRGILLIDLLHLFSVAIKYSMFDSDDEFDGCVKSDARKQKAVISDDEDDNSFAPDPDSDLDSPKAPEPT